MHREAVQPAKQPQGKLTAWEGGKTQPSTKFIFRPSNLLASVHLHGVTLNVCKGDRTQHHLLTLPIKCMSVKPEYHKPPPM